MKIFCCNSFLILKLFFLCLEKCNTFQLHLHRMVKNDNFHQTTLFTSGNCPRVFEQDLLLFNEFPKKIYSFSKKNYDLSRNYSQHALQNMYSLQDSIVTFSICELREIKPSIDSLSKNLSIRKRPKCLAMYSQSRLINTNEIIIINAIKYVWGKKFLDFTVIKKNPEEITIDLRYVIYYSNPFNHIIYRRYFKNEDLQIFPDKLINGFGYSLYTDNVISDEPKIIKIKRPNQEMKIYISARLSFYFAAKILNLTLIVKKNIIHRVDSLDDWSLDVHVNYVSGTNYLSDFLIPADTDPPSILAYVPMIPDSRIKFFLKSSYLFIVVLVSTFGLLSSIFKL